MIVVDLDLALGAQEPVEVDGCRAAESRIDDEDLRRTSRAGPRRRACSRWSGRRSRTAARRRSRSASGGRRSLPDSPGCAAQRDPLGERQLRRGSPPGRPRRDPRGCRPRRRCRARATALAICVVGQCFRRSGRGSPRRPRSATSKSKSAPSSATSGGAVRGMQRLEQVAELGLVQIVDFMLAASSVSRSAIAAPICARKERNYDAVLAIDFGVVRRRPCAGVRSSWPSTSASASRSRKGGLGLEHRAQVETGFGKIVPKVRNAREYQTK